MGKPRTPTCSGSRSTRSIRTRSSLAGGSSLRRPPGWRRRSGTRECSSRSWYDRAPSGGYELIAGERRWRAAREAGLDTLPALVRDTDDRETLLLSLVENVAREDLSPVEEARAYAVLVDEFELSLGDLAQRVGRSKAGVSNRLRLLELPEEVLWMLARGELTEGHGRAVLAVPDDDARLRLARRAARDGLTVRATERAAQESGARRRPRSSPVDPALAERARHAAEQLTGLPARVSAGKLELHFGDETRLAELVETLESL